jgi:hypothetical protein
VSSKRRTIAEARFPGGRAFQTLVSTWSDDAAIRLLGFVWSGCDLLRRDVLDDVDAANADEDLERSVTQLLEPRIRAAMTGDEPFDIQHGPYEEETRQAAPAQPPQYDLAFVLRANPRIMWPIEAKLIRKSSDVSRYVGAVTANFLTCRYAPFSRAGAMLGYLLVNDTKAVFANIERSLKCNLKDVHGYNSRPHKRSTHSRQVPNPLHS